MKTYEKSRESHTTPTVNDKVVSLSALCSCANDQDAERSSARLPAPGGCGYLANHGVVLWECLTRVFYEWSFNLFYQKSNIASTRFNHSFKPNHPGIETSDLKEPENESWSLVRSLLTVSSVDIRGGENCVNGLIETSPQGLHTSPTLLPVVDNRQLFHKKHKLQ